MSVAILAWLAIPAAADDAEASPFAQSVRAAIEQALDTVAKDGDYDRAEAALLAQFDLVVFHGRDEDGLLLRDASHALRMIRQLRDVDSDRRTDLLTYLRAHPDLARTLVFLIRPEKERTSDVYALLDRMRDRAGDYVQSYPALAAAICVVHDRPMTRQVNENRTASPDPLRLFEFFITNEKRMLFGIRNVPAELLIYVVDVTTSIDDLQWAVNRYTGHRNIGQLFFQIDYDYEHFQKGKPKQCTLAGYSLPSIEKYGGVCADQAFFAMSVGKAIGVPTTYTIGRDAEVAHAWVGFLQADRKRAWWNFNAGRYETYQGVKGHILDPQVRTLVADSDLSLLASMSNSSADDRQAAAAFVEAGRRMLELEQEDWRAEPPTVPSDARDGTRSAPRKRSLETALALVELGLRRFPGTIEGWQTVATLAAEERLSLEQKKRWATVLDRMCGTDFPDFSLAVLAPMISTVEDLDEQNSLWNRAFKRFAARQDLAAEIRFRQGRMWEKEGEYAKAGQCYEDIIGRYANSGPFILQALVRAQRVLELTGNERMIPTLYERAWNRTQRPRDMAREFSTQSNWYRVGRLYARRLEEAGRGRDAAAVWQKLGGK